MTSASSRCRLSHTGSNAAPDLQHLPALSTSSHHPRLNASESPQMARRLPSLGRPKYMSSFCGTPIPHIQPQAFSAETLPWFAIHVRSNFEHQVFNQLDAKGFKVFLPEYKLRRR